MSSEDYYSILEVGQSASSSEIKQSYKKLARKYHPDNKETGDENLFKKLGEAYSVLSDEQKRSVYDRLGHQAFAEGGGSTRYGAGFNNADMFNDLSDVFETFFGSSFASGGARRGRNARERGADLQVVLDLDFTEAAFGANRKITVSRLINCQSCSGSGADPSVGLKTCTSCQGTGEVKRVTQSFLGVITQVSTCPTCQGKGSIISTPCKTCSGKGQSKEASELDVKIPKGVEDGSRLVWSQKGNEGRNNGPSGDLYILLRVKPHPRLKREKLDIFEEVNINVWQAIMGEKLQVETIHGSQEVEIKPGMQSGTVISLNGMGIQLENGQSGGHHVRFNVQIPHRKDLPKEMQEFINEEILGKEENHLSAFANLFKRNKAKD